MYDLKDLEKQETKLKSNIELSDRAYYGKHLTDNIFRTKTSYISTDYLL